jgi:hypothetical protein
MRVALHPRLRGDGGGRWGGTQRATGDLIPRKAGTLSFAGVSAGGIGVALDIER